MPRVLRDWSIVMLKFSTGSIVPASALFMAACLVFGALGGVVYAKEAPGAEPKPGARDAEDAVRSTEELVEALKSKSPDELTTAANEAAKVPDHELLRPLTKLLSNKDRAVRIAAVDALKTRQEKADRKKAASSLGAHLNKRTKLEDLPERLAVIYALHDLAEPGSMKALLDGIDRNMEAGEVSARLKAVANVPSKEAIELLIKFMDSGGRRDRPGQRGAADGALRYATGAGNIRKQWNRIKGRGGDNAWREWWRENKKTFDPKAAAAKREEARKEAAEKEAKRLEKRKKKKERAKQKKKGKKKHQKEPQGEEA